MNNSCSRKNTSGRKMLEKGNYKTELYVILPYTGNLVLKNLKLVFSLLYKCYFNTFSNILHNRLNKLFEISVIMLEV